MCGARGTQQHWWYWNVRTEVGTDGHIHGTLLRCRVGVVKRWLTRILRVHQEVDAERDAFSSGRDMHITYVYGTQEDSPEAPPGPGNQYAPPPGRSMGRVQRPGTAANRVWVGVAVSAVAFVLGAVLVIHPNGDRQSPPSTGASQPTASASEPAATSSPGVPATTSSPQASATQKPLYLDTLTPITDGEQAPEAGSWQLGTRTYPNSLEYTVDTPGVSNACYLSATYNIPSSYQYLVATVGIPDSSGSQGATIDFEVAEDFGNPLGDQTAQYGQPEQIRVPIQGANTLTLLTSSPQTCGEGSGWEAVWGDVELLP